MPWDSKGWHEFEGGSGMAELNFCVHCRFHKSAHLSKVDYVAMRLDGKRTPDPVFEFGFTGWKEISEAIDTAPSYIFQCPGQTVAPQGEE